MKVALVADIHLGNHRQFRGTTEAGLNRRCRLILDTIRRAVNLAIKNHCKYIISLGDAFDVHNPTPQVIASLMQIIDDSPEWKFLLGNHEPSSGIVGDSALAPLFPIAQVIERPVFVELSSQAALACVPFQAGPAIDWFEGAVIQAIRPGFVGHTLLCFHLGVSDRLTPSFMRDAHDSISIEFLCEVMARHNLRWAVCGNWHDRRIWKLDGRQILQVGTLAPTGFDNPGLSYGSMAMWDLTHGLSSYQIPGPRFVKSRNYLDVEEDVSGAFEEDEVFSIIRVIPDRVSEARAHMRELVDRGVISDFQIEIEHRWDIERARKAASAASEEKTLDAAIDKYVRTLQLPKGVTTGRVLELVKHFYAG